VDAICPENAELAFVITAEVDVTATALASAGQRNLVNGSHAATILVLKQDNRLTGYGRRQTKLSKLDNFAGNRLLRKSGW
jgi:hypothetical protein